MHTLSRIGRSVLAGLFCVAVASGATAAPARKKLSRAASVQTAAKAPAPSVTSRKALFAPDRSLSRKAAAARARSIATTRAINTATPRFKVDESGEVVPDLRAAAAIIYDPNTNHILWESNSQDQRSIASITKVMTATVFLEDNPDVNQVVTMARTDVFQASTTHVKLNDKVTVDDLLHLLLISSDNAAARALARVSPYGTEGFIARMNEKAEELGLTTTHYADPSGLLSDNVSSAYDMARLIAHASADERIASIMRLREYTVHAARRDIMIHSTDRLLGHEDFDVRAAKTGFISKAGYCFASLLRLPQTGHDVAVVVLGARSNAGRFAETQNLFRWLSSRATTIFATETVAATAAAQQ